MTAAIYCRSAISAPESQYSLVEQRFQLLAYAALKGLKVVAEYIDEGVGGTRPIDVRPAGAQLVRDARKGKFSTLLVTDFTRIARSAAACSLSATLLDSCGVDVILVNGGSWQTAKWLAHWVDAA